jgi:hypothetical protein
MAPTYEAIQPDFDRLRNFILSDLDGFVAQETGGNYSVVSLVLSACEAVGKVRYEGGKPEVKVFRDLLPHDWKPVADSLYNALRNGLVHNNEPRPIDLGGGETVTFAFAWRGPRHLQVAAESGRVVVIGRDLVQSLRRVFADFQAELRANPETRDFFAKKTKRLADKRVDPGATGMAAWRLLLESLEPVARPSESR